MLHDESRRVPQASLLRLGNCGWQRRSYRASLRRPTTSPGPSSRLPRRVGAICHHFPRAPLLFRRFSTAPPLKFTSAFYSFVVISHMIRQATRLASDSLPPLFPCQLSSKSFRPKLLRTLFALSRATARSKPCVFSCLRTHCRRNGVVWVCLTKFLRSHSTFSRPLTRLPAVGGPAHRGGQLS